MTAEKFKQEYFSLHPKLYRIAFAILRNAEDAEDIIQELYCKLWDSIEKFSEVQKPEAYCVILVKNMCMDLLRSSKVNQTNLNIDDYDFPDSSTNAEDDIDNKEAIKKIKYIMNSLPEKQQRILSLRGFGGCTFEEIEEITGESAVNIRVLLSRARNTLRINLIR